MSIADNTTHIGPALLYLRPENIILRQSAAVNTVFCPKKPQSCRLYGRHTKSRVVSYAALPSNPFSAKECLSDCPGTVSLSAGVIIRTYSCPAFFCLLFFLRKSVCPTVPARYPVFVGTPHELSPARLSFAYFSFRERKVSQIFISPKRSQPFLRISSLTGSAMTTGTIK